MSIFLIKSLIAVLFLAAAATAAFSMLTLMGKVEKKADPLKLRKLHKLAGFTFGVLLLILSVLCFNYWTKAGDGISARAVFHSYLSLALLAVFFLKFLIVKIFRGFLKVAPALGLTIFAMALVVFLGSAGYYFLRSVRAPAVSAAVTAELPPGPSADARQGAMIFQGRCAGCHFADRLDAKSGPGLSGLLYRPTLPASGRPATVENVRQQLKTPFLAMPAFPDLSEQGLTDLIAYLKTL